MYSTGEVQGVTRVGSKVLPDSGIISPPWGGNVFDQAIQRFYMDVIFRQTLM